MDSGKCQTFTASPAKPGVFLLMDNRSPPAGLQPNGTPQTGAGRTDTAPQERQSPAALPIFAYTSADPARWKNKKGLPLSL
jgi:hypothetical protein